MISKKRIDPTKPITMKELFESGAVSRIRKGLIIVEAGSEDFKKLGIQIKLEVSDATEEAIKIIKETGSTLVAVYHTETTLKRLLTPYKFKVPEAKIPMPPARTVLKLEQLKEKGIDVIYPKAPWYEEYR